MSVRIISYNQVGAEVRPEMAITEKPVADWLFELWQQYAGQHTFQIVNVVEVTEASPDVAEWLLRCARYRELPEFLDGLPEE